MKKLLVLMLVLCVATAASATMSLKVATGVAGAFPEQGAYYNPVDSQINLQASDTIWIGIYNDTQGVAGATQQGEFFLVIVPPPTGGTNGEWIQDGGNHLYQPPCISGAHNDYLGIIDFENGLGNVDTWDAVLSSANAEAFNGIGVLDSKLFHCLGLGDVEIVLMNASAVVIDSFIIHQVPEPVTIALLGLGGLLLRRRIA